jgi:hypothetical protein
LFLLAKAQRRKEIKALFARRGGQALCAFASSRAILFFFTPQINHIAPSSAYFFFLDLRGLVPSAGADRQHAKKKLPLNPLPFQSHLQARQTQ